MYVTDQSSVSGSGNGICDRVVYPERVVVAQVDREELYRQNNPLDQLKGPLGHLKQFQYQGKSLQDIIYSAEEEKKVCRQLYEEASSELQNEDKKILAGACSKLEAVAMRFPEMIAEKVIPSIIQNLSNKETGKYYVIHIPPSSDFKIMIEEMPGLLPTYIGAESILVKLGNRALPALKQALSSKDAQIRERAKAIISEIEKNETPAPDKANQTEVPSQPGNPAGGTEKK
ncbi:MAG: hypothetical protein WC527_01295 [Candidatus Margulisiibacteriota bacterium]